MVPSLGTLLTIGGAICLTCVILRYPELGLVLCATMGSIAKGFLQPYLGPVDLTIILYAVTALAIVIRLSGRGNFQRFMLQPSTFLATALVVLLGISILWTPVPRLAWLTLGRFIAFDVGLFGMTVLCLASRERMRRFARLFAWIGCSVGTLLLVVVLFLPQLDISIQTWRALPITAAPLGTGWILGIAILLALGEMFSDRTAKRTGRWILYLLLLVATVEVTALNSRGPLFALGIGVAVFGLIGLKRFSFVRLVRYLAPILISVILAYLFLPETYTFRYAPAVSLSSTSASVVVRTSHRDFVLEHFDEWWVGGAGLAGYASLYLGEETGASTAGVYPHNLLMDLFAHAGLGAVLLMVALIIVLLWTGLRLFLRAPPHSGPALAVVSCVFLLVAASQFSMSLLDTRLLWLLFGVVVACRVMKIAVPLNRNSPVI